MIGGLVLGPNGPQKELLPIREGNRLLKLLGIRPNGHTIQTRHARGSHAAASPPRDHPPSVGGQGVDLHLLDLRNVADELGNLDQDQDRPFQDRPWNDPFPLKVLEDPCPGHHLPGQIHIERGQSICLVLDMLRSPAASTESDDGTELHVQENADEELMGMRTRVRDLDGNPVGRENRSDLLRRELAPAFLEGVSHQVFGSLGIGAERLRKARDRFHQHFLVALVLAHLQVAPHG